MILLPRAWKSGGSLFRAHLSAALDLLLPPRCVACFLHIDPEHAFCPACAATLLPARAPVLFAGLGVKPMWGPPSGAVAWQSASAAFLYGGQLAVALGRLKYGRQAHVARPLGRLLAGHLSPLLARVDVLVPVPLHPRRLAERGYNQAALLASAALHAVAQMSPSTAVRRPVVQAGALRRLRLTPPQTQLARAQRLANLRGVFQGNAALVAGRRILLIDDVLTTGATADACTRALLGAGAAEVHVLTLARAMP